MFPGCTRAQRYCAHQRSDLRNLPIIPSRWRRQRLRLSTAVEPTLVLSVTVVALAFEHGPAINTWRCLLLHAANGKVLNGFRSSWESFGTDTHLRRVAATQQSSALFNQKRVTSVVMTSERLQCALHDVSLDVVKVIPALANFQAASKRLFAVGKRPARTV